MSKFITRRSVDLSFLGEGWEPCSVTFSAFSPSDVLQISKLSQAPEDRTETFSSLLDILKDHFIEGTGLTAAGVVPLEAKDLDELPIEVVNKAIEALNGNVSPNSVTPSTP